MNLEAELNKADQQAHQAALELLPWYVNGQLSDAERMDIEAHLRDCASCQDELRMQREVQEAVAKDARSRTDSVDVDSHWEAFRGRLKAAPAASSGHNARPWRGKAWLIPAAAAAMVLLAIPMALDTSGGFPGFRRSAQQQQAQDRSDLLRIVFASGASSRSIDTLLDANGLQELPGQEGALVRTVQILPVSNQMPGRDTDLLIEQLSESSVVVFVECIE